MTDKLPANLLQLFTPRPPLRYLPPQDFAPEERRTAHVTGLGDYLSALKEYKENPPKQCHPATESWLERRDRRKSEKMEKLEKNLTDGIAHYNPNNDDKIKGDPYRTLFVARMSYDVTTQDLEREFGRFGPIERIRIVKNEYATDEQKKKKPHRGYAFIVYEREKDMKAAYKETDGIRIRDRRVLVDVERGRTVGGWRPRRFGGGLGGRHYTKTLPQKPAGGFLPGGPGSFRGGLSGSFRGGRGGFRGDFGSRGGFRGGYSGSRGGVGFQANGWGSGAPPEGAPSGPRGGRGGGGYGSRFNDQQTFDDRGRDRRYGGRSYEDRGGPSGSNREPVGQRGSGGYRDRDREGGYGRDDYPRKRAYDGDTYDDSRSNKRRY